MRCLLALFCFIAGFVSANLSVVADVVIIRSEPFESNIDGTKPEGGIVTLKNYGDGAIDINQWVRSQHWHAIDIENGLSILEPGETVSLTFRPLEPIEDISMRSNFIDLENSEFKSLDTGYVGFLDGAAIDVADHIKNDKATDTWSGNDLFANGSKSASMDEESGEDEEESAIAIPEPANMLAFALLAISGIAFAIWHRASIHKAAGNDNANHVDSSAAVEAH